MDSRLTLCLVDGTDIILDGFDTLGFSNDFPAIDISYDAYDWCEKYYDSLICNLGKYAIVSIKRHSNSDKLKYRDHSYAYQNENFEHNEPLLLRTSSIVTIQRSQS